MREHLNHHDQTIVPGRAEDGEASCWSMDLRLLLDTAEVLALADALEGFGYTDHADAMRERVTEPRLSCTGCGREGNADDGIEMGGPCQYADDETDPCAGTIFAMEVEA